METGLCTLPLSVLGPRLAQSCFLAVFSPSCSYNLSTSCPSEDIFFPFFNEAEGLSAKNEIGGGVGVVKPFGEKSWVNEQGCEGRIPAASASQKLPGKMYKMPGMVAPEAA